MLWEDLVRAIRVNAERNTFVKVLRVWRSSSAVDSFPLVLGTTVPIVQITPTKIVQQAPPALPVPVIRTP